MLPPGIGRDGLRFAIDKGSVHCKLLTIGGLNEGFVSRVVSRHVGGPCRSFFSFYGELCNEGVGDETVRDLVGYNTFSKLKTGHERLLTVDGAILSSIRCRDEEGTNNRVSFFSSTRISTRSSGPGVPSLPRFPISRLLRVRGRVTKVCLDNRPLSRCAAFSGTVRTSGANSVVGGSDNVCFSKGGIDLIYVITGLGARLAGGGEVVTFIGTRSECKVLRVIVFPGMCRGCSTLLNTNNTLLFHKAIGLGRGRRPGVVYSSVTSTHAGRSYGGGPITVGGARRFSRGCRVRTIGGSARGPSTLCLHVSSLGASGCGHTGHILSVFSNEAPIVFCLASAGEGIGTPSSV